MGKGDRRIVAKCGTYLVEMGRIGARIEMDRDIVASRRQPLSLTDDGVWVLVTQQDIGDLGHCASSDALGTALGLS